MAALLGGCLSTPDPSAADAMVESIDAMGSPCGARSDFTPRAFPPASMQLGIRHIIAADVNLDGDVDLVLTNADVADENDYGFFVLLGPQPDPEQLQFHAFVSTGVAPHALTVHDVVGGACPDVTVFGHGKGTATGYVEVYETAGGAELLAPIPIRKDVAFDPEGDASPVHVLYAALESDGQPNDLVVGDLYQLRVLLTGGDDFANELATAIPTGVGPDGTDQTTWSDVNAVFARSSPTSPDVDDLLVIEINNYTWMINDGGGGFGGAAPVTVNNNYDFNAQGVVEFDFDGADPIDVLAGGGTGFGGYLVAQTDSVVAPTTFQWFGDMPSTDGIMDDILVADLGGGSQPEVVMIDYHATAGSAAHLVDGTFVSNQEIMPTTVSSYDFIGANPKNAALAEFSGAGGLEVWAFDPDGSARCIERDPALPQLRACQ